MDLSVLKTVGFSVSDELYIEHHHLVTNQSLQQNRIETEKNGGDQAGRASSPEFSIHPGYQASDPVTS
jgi:hypothetical protein